jgi:hypothetical protein
MASSRMLRRVALARTDVSEELGTMLAVIHVTLMKEALSSSETSVMNLWVPYREGPSVGLTERSPLHAVI